MIQGWKTAVAVVIDPRVWLAARSIEVQTSEPDKPDKSWNALSNCPQLTQHSMLCPAAHRFLKEVLSYKS